jgi:hypothetical protein
VAFPSEGIPNLCHPSLKNDEQAIAWRKINIFLTDVYRALLYQDDKDKILTDLRSAYVELITTLQDQPPTFDEISEVMRRQLPGRRLLVINARVKRQGIDYGRGLNFLIGGNTLGRGIAISDLLVTYYVREAKVSQIDTMHQHACMYGYRSETLPYTRLFIPRLLYYRFRDIHRSDEDLRAFVEKHQEDLPTTFPVEVSFNLRATRQGVLEVGKIDTLQPGMQVYPNFIVIPQPPPIYAKIITRLAALFAASSGTIEEIERMARRGKEIDPVTAAALVAPIRTESKNTWRDSTISDVIKKVAGEFDDRIMVRFRRASRTVMEDGFISTGTLSGDELRTARAANRPTLWIMAVTTMPGSAVGANQRFVYPTFVIPDRFPSLFIFNRGT